VKHFYHCEKEDINFADNVADNSISFQQILMICFRGAGCLTSIKPFSSGADP